MLTLLLIACSSTPEPTSAVEAPPTEQPATAAAPKQAPAPRKPGVKTHADGGYSDVTAAQLHDKHPEVYVVDVRTPQEFAQGHVPGAVNITIETLLADASKLDDNRGEDIYFICHSGSRSKMVAKKLSTQGFSAFNVTGGTQAWINASYPTE